MIKRALYALACVLWAVLAGWLLALAAQAVVVQGPAWTLVLGIAAMAAIVLTLDGVK